MRCRTTSVVASLLWWGAVACSGSSEEPPALLDTGWFVDTAAAAVDPATCPHRFVEWTPESGDAGVYWRTHPSFKVATERSESYGVWLADADGERVLTTTVWSPDLLSGGLEWEGWLKPNTSYIMTMRDCAGTTEIPFTTSGFGVALDESPQGLVGTTWELDLLHANWVEPATLAGLLQLYMNTPILLGVQYADLKQIDLLGAPGVVDNLGQVDQDLSVPAWDFPLADFSGQPFLTADVASITLQYNDGSGVVDIPVQDFHFEATISADGRRLGGGKLSGLGDTRYLGGVIDDSDNPGALCELAASLGVYCEACADGGEYCLKLAAENVNGAAVPGLVLQPQ